MMILHAVHKFFILCDFISSEGRGQGMRWQRIKHMMLHCVLTEPKSC